MPTAMVDTFGSSNTSSRLGVVAAFSGSSATPPESPSSTRHKAPPVCVDTFLMSSAMTTDALSELAFPSNSVVGCKEDDDAPATTSGSPSPRHAAPPSNVVVVIAGATSAAVTTSGGAAAIPVSSSSSTCTRESDTLSDVEGLGGHHHPPHPHATLVPHANLMHHCRPSPQILPKDESAGGASNKVAADVVPHHPPSSSDGNDVLNGALSAKESASYVGGATPKDKSMYNAKVSLMKTSRQGRSSQRWLVEGGETVRLVTGCVPILRSGKVLFISSSRQSEWILPKGGWEQDESMEESAVRECFEEAGVLGSLGPPLAAVQYETRKAKKRRLEQEDILSKRPKDGVAALDDAPAGGAETAALSSPAPMLPLPPPEEAPCEAQVLPSPSQSTQSPMASSTASGSTPTPTQHLDWTRIRWLAQQNAPRMSSSDETASVASNVSSSTATAAHSHVRMTLFPLYVTDVHADWPERGRLRTSVDIDQAIAMMDSRPEFKVALQEIKARGLHIVEEEPHKRRTPTGPVQSSIP